jgi:hypothetical protein
MTARWSDPHRLPGASTGSENAAADRLGLSHSTVWILAPRLPEPESMAGGDE